MREVVQTVAAQKPRPVIFLWDNGHHPDLEGEVDWYVRSSINRRCWPRWYMALHATTEFICTLDDDLTFGDETLLSDLVALHRSRGDSQAIVGPCGVVLKEGASYRDAVHIHPFRRPVADASCDIVKGRCMLLTHEALLRATLPTNYFSHQDDDIIMSATLAGGRRGAHLCVGSLGPRFRLLPEPHALKNQPEHWNRRTQCCNTHFRTQLPTD
jgi:hypothetical protein